MVSCITRRNRSGPENNLFLRLLSESRKRGYLESGTKEENDDYSRIRCNNGKKDEQKIAIIPLEPFLPPT